MVAKLLTDGFDPRRLFFGLVRLLAAHWLLVAALACVGVLVGTVAARWVRGWRAGEAARGVWLQVQVPAQVSAEAAGVFARRVAGGLHRTRGLGVAARHVVLEIVATATGTRIGVWLPPQQDPGPVTAALADAWPGAKITRVVPPALDGHMVAVELTARYGAWVPWTDVRPAAKTGPAPVPDRLAGVLEGLQARPEGETGFVQLVLAPYYRRTGPRLLGKALGKVLDELMAMARMLYADPRAPAPARPATPSLSPMVSARQQAERAKMAASPHLSATLRVGLVSAGRVPRGRMRVAGIAGGFDAIADSPDTGGLVTRRVRGAYRVVARRPGRGSWPRSPRWPRCGICPPTPPGSGSRSCGRAPAPRARACPAWATPPRCKPLLPRLSARPCSPRQRPTDRHRGPGTPVPRPGQVRDLSHLPAVCACLLLTCPPGVAGPLRAARVPGPGRARFLRLISVEQQGVPMTTPQPPSTQNTGTPGVGRLRLAPADAPGRAAPKPLGVGLDGFVIGLPVSSARHHVHVPGVTGSGKSTWLAQLALAEAAAGRGLVLLDCQGDLADNVLARLPDEAAGRLVVLDPSERTAPPAWNVLAPASGREDDAEGREFAARTVIGTFRKVYAQWWGPRMDEMFSAACLTLARRPGATLADVVTILTDPGYHRSITARHGEPGGFEGFWQGFAAMNPAQRQQLCGPVISRLRDVLSHRFARDLLTAPASTFTLTDILDGGILIARLPKGEIGEHGAQLVGSLLLSGLWQATTRRAGIPPEDRADATIIVDECHNFLHLPIGIDQVLAEARGCRLSLVLAHQHLAQLPPDIRGAVDANARNKIVFTVAPDDARALTPHFEPIFDHTDLRNRDGYAASVRIIDQGIAIEPFSITTLPLPPEIPGRAQTMRAAARTTAGLSAQRRAALRQRADLTAARQRHDDPGGHRDSQPGSRPVSRSLSHLDRDTPPDPSPLVKGWEPW